MANQEVTVSAKVPFLLKQKAEVRAAADGLKLGTWLRELVSSELDGKRQGDTHLAQVHELLRDLSARWDLALEQQRRDLAGFLQIVLMNPELLPNGGLDEEDVYELLSRVFGQSSTTGATEW